MDIPPRGNDVVSKLAFQLGCCLTVALMDNQAVAVVINVTQDVISRNGPATISNSTLVNVVLPLAPETEDSA